MQAAPNCPQKANGWACSFRCWPQASADNYQRYYSFKLDTL